MRPMRAALVAVVMMGAMVSCANGSAGDRGDAAALGRTVEATQSIDSGRVEMRTVYTGLGRLRDAPPGVDEVHIVQRAGFDRRTRRAHAEGDMSELAAVLNTAHESVPGDYSRPTRFVIDGDTVYAQIGPMAQVIGLEPTTWIRRDLDGFTSQSIDNETAALLLDPLGMLGLLRRPLRDVRPAGRDEVRGVRATHMTATVDLAPGPAGGVAGAGGHGAPGDAVEARFRSIGVDELPVDVWVGDDEVVRRLEFRLAAGPAGSGGLTSTFDVYDVDDAIDVALPAAGDVVDQAELRSRLSDP